MPVFEADAETALHTVTFAVHATVGAHQPETEIRRQLAETLREQATRLERGEFVVPENDSGLEPGFIPWKAPSPVVHAYKGEGLTACGLEVVGPCPDCERAT